VSGTGQAVASKGSLAEPRKVTRCLLALRVKETARRAELFCPIGACPELIEGSPDRAKKDLILCSLCLCG
jgi:hypothetical protein